MSTWELTVDPLPSKADVIDDAPASNISDDTPLVLDPASDPIPSIPTSDPSN